MHFVYKTNNLFQSIRVSYETRLLQRDFIFFKLLHLHTFCAFSMHRSKPCHQLPTFPDLICYFSCIYWFFIELNDPEIEKQYKWTLKRLKFGMVSSFHPHSMCGEVERVTAKTGCTSCTKRTIGFRSISVTDETPSVWKAFHFFQSYYSSTLFVRSVCTIESQVINFQPFLTSFAIFHTFTVFFFS